MRTHIFFINTSIKCISVTILPLNLDWFCDCWGSEPVSILNLVFKKLAQLLRRQMGELQLEVSLYKKQNHISTSKSGTVVHTCHPSYVKGHGLED
jgi:hypothetical protein